MFLVPSDSKGLARRRQHAMMFPGGDTSELFFDDLRVRPTACSAARARDSACSSP
jgi:alkylation response protein AidB-like acyl-CoA dehydrogenase